MNYHVYILYANIKCFDLNNIRSMAACFQKQLLQKTV